MTEETIRHLLLDQVIPRVLAHHDQIVLHASAIAINGAAIAFVGESGAGKSTLATSFHENGHALLTDDSLLVKWEGHDIVAIPGYSGARLWEDSISAVVGAGHNLQDVAHYSSKKRLNLQGDRKTDDSSISLEAVFVLENSIQCGSSNEITVEEMAGSSRVMKLLNHTIVLDAKDRDRTRAQFCAVGHIADAGISVYKLHYPRQYEFIDQVRETIVKSLARNPPGLTDSR
jgi:hypothetical protein